MILEYLKFKEKGAKIIEWKFKKDGDIKRRYVFNPQCEVPEELGQKMLDKLKSEFMVAGEIPATDPLRCEVCGFIGKNAHSLHTHFSKKHEEKKQ